jgi:hypothetical protein
MLILRDGKIVESEHINSRQPAFIPMRLQLITTPDDIGQTLAAIEGVGSIDVQGEIVTFQCVPDHEVQHSILKQLIDQDIQVCAYGEERMNMQDAYLATLKK